MDDGGIPNRAMRPPWFIVFSMALNALGTPDISKPTSKPSVMPSSFITSSRFCSVTFTARVTPIWRAKSRRYSFTSVITTWRAPTCFATAAAIIPIGPAPVISTSSPTKSNESAVCTALPNGSKIDARSSEIPSGILNALNAGITKYSEKQPVRFTPTPMVLRHKCVRPPRQLRQ